MKTVCGIIEFNGEEYEYKAEIGERGKDYHPDRIADLDCADGSSLPDDIDYDALEELAIQNAGLLDWCERNGFEEVDTGGGCTAFSRTVDGVTILITRADDPSVPQTCTDPVNVGRYDQGGELIGQVAKYDGGIDELISDWY